MATFSVKEGALLRLVRGELASGSWVSVPAPTSEVGNKSVIVSALSILPGQTHVVFRGRDGSVYAQNLAIALDPETASVGTEPQPRSERVGGKEGK